MKTKKVVLIQPRAATGNHIYLPNGLLAVAARLMAVGIEVKIYDLNISNKLSRTVLESADWIGIGMLGAPYIPQAIILGHQLSWAKIRKPVFYGGFGVEKLSDQDWQKVFLAQNAGHDRFALLTENDLAMNLGIPDLPSIFDISMGPAMETLDVELQKAYFSKEFCIFTSDGCIYNCSFCAANKGRPEKFRKSEAFREELRVIAKMVRKWNFDKHDLHSLNIHPDYEIYLSTLDGLQTPDKMEQMLNIIHDEFFEARVSVPLRFLATSHFTFKAVQRDPDILNRWHWRHNVGCIGIGVDGADEKSWLALRKGHNKPDEIQAVLLAIQEAGMIAEALMVIGFPGESREASLKSLAACHTLTKQGIKIRPYLGKINPPGTEGFSIDPFLAIGGLQKFTHLDYGMIGSKLTHPNGQQRRFANWIYLRAVLYLKLFNPHGCPTQPLLPAYQGTKLFRWIARTWNSWMPIDR